MATQQTMQAMDLCDQLLVELAKPRWWVPDSLEDMARQMRPGLKHTQTGLKVGLQQGANALQDFLKEMLGEDGSAVVTKAIAVAGAVVSVGGQGNAHRAHSGGKDQHAKAEAAHKTADKPADKHAEKPADNHPEKATQTADHGKVNDAERQFKSDKEQGRLKRYTRSTATVLESLTYMQRGLAGEHIADYHHLKNYLHAPDAWPHGHTHETGGRWANTYPRVVADGKRPERAMQIVKADLPLIREPGLDSTWRKDEHTIHFVEAKTSTNYYALRNRGEQGEIGHAPLTLNGKRAALWYLLSETKTKGTQMSRRWILGSLPAGVDQTSAERDIGNRFVHLILFLPSDAEAFKKVGHKGAMPKETKLPQLEDTAKHLMIATEVLLNGVDERDIKIQDQHKTEHLVTETFLAGDIDRVEQARNKYGSTKKQQQTKGASTKGRSK